MKNGILALILIFFQIAVFGQSNIYHPIPESNAMWREYFGGYQVNCTDYQLSITGDTLINGIKYHKLSYFGVVHYTDITGNCLSGFSGPYTYDEGAFRNDSLNKKVYYWNHIEGEQLLYDFNLNLNDKLPQTYGYRYYDGGDTAFVSSVDSVLVNGEYHKRFGISNSYEQNYVYLIEGIGSTFGFKSFLEPPFEFGSTLICFLIDSVSVYSDSWQDCTLVTHMEGHHKSEKQLSILPNPIVSGSGVVRMPFNLPSSQLVIFDVVGNMVLTVNSIKDGMEINFGNLNSGVYFYKLITGKQISSFGKLIISN